MIIKEDEQFRNKIISEVMSIHWHLRQCIDNKNTVNSVFDLGDTLDQLIDLAELVSTDFVIEKDEEHDP